jgi:hypothetical protein
MKASAWLVSFAIACAACTNDHANDCAHAIAVLRASGAAECATWCATSISCSSTDVCTLTPLDCNSRVTYCESGRLVVSTTGHACPDVGVPPADADIDAAIADAADMASMDGGVCSPSGTPPSCHVDADCEAWGASVAPPSTQAVTMCGLRPGNPNGNCTNGVTDCRMSAFNVQCLCGPAVGNCPPAFICVSDRPGGPTRCVAECEGH